MNQYRSTLAFLGTAALLLPACGPGNGSGGGGSSSSMDLSQVSSGFSQLLPHQALRLDDGWDVESAFAGFDTNQDGHMSRDEFADVTRDYWTNFDASIPAHRWLGP